jgi:hypothetical protein
MLFLNYCHEMVGRENKCPLAPSPNHPQTVSHELIFRRGEVYSTQTILNFVSDLQKVICFLRVLWYLPPNTNEVSYC